MLSVILGIAENLKTDDATNSDIEVIADNISETVKGPLCWPASSWSSARGCPFEDLPLGSRRGD